MPDSGWGRRRLQRRGNGAEAEQASFDVVDDLVGQVGGLWQIVEIGEAVVLEPEEIETGFVAGNELFVGKFAPTAFRILLGVPRFLALVTIDRVVAIDEIAQIFQTQRLALERVVDIRPVVVIPNFLGRRFLASGTVVEEEHICLHPLGIEDARGQAKDGVQLGGFEELLSNNFPCPAFK